MDKKPLICYRECDKNKRFFDTFKYLCGVKKKT